MSISRRNFLRGVGIGCSACAIGSFPPGALARNPTDTLSGRSALTPSLCEMCSFRCPIQAQVVNNKTVFIQGNPHAPQQGTRICARGGSGVSLVNDPHRIVKPMKRTGPRGSGEWQVISWQQAYKEIAEKMNNIKAQSGPQSVMFSSKSGSLSGHLFHLATAFGSPNTFTHASTCPAGKSIAAKVMMGGDLAMDIANTRYMVSFGHNLYEGIEVADTLELMSAQENGAKMVSFDPRLSVFSSKADEWHAIRPGGDLPVLMAMCHVMIKENLYDAAFVERYTSGFTQLTEAVQAATPEWAQQLSDVPADIIVRVTRELAACAPRAIVSPGHRATYSQEEIDMRRMIFTLNALLGNIEREGGLYQKKSAATYNKLAGEKVAPVLAKPDIQNMPKPTAQRIDLVAPQFKFIAASGGVVQSIIDAVLNETAYPVKGWIMSRHNPLQTVTCRPALVKTVEKLDLVVSCDVYLSESAAYADYLLPECTYLERDEEVSDMSGLNPAYALRQQVIKPIGEARPGWQIWKELGEQLGLGQFYPWQDMQTRQLHQLNGDHALSKALRDKGYLEWGVPLLLREPESVRQFAGRYPGAVAMDSDNTYGEQLRFKSPSGKIELYSETLEALLPGYGAPKARDFPLKKSNELYFIQGKVAVHTNGATQYVPMLSELMWDNAVWIHPQTAREKGIKTGDEIWLENATGKEKGKALVTAGIRPDTLFVYMGFGARAGAKTAATTHGIHCGNLLPHVTSPVSGTVVHTAGVTLSRA
ncbi:thiosulfate reductase PhsA [Citrobacter amalonaticus]|uniref:Thiosulfate reductase PhsA n=1 Tax=Citrobacter amalonaticus TaxID=35703 RepID=A0A2S4S0Q2_CITAM|nr:thiosulfate reductase PhsA [Citrobacter amalonaticus]POT58484.1 thiosulfate reductase PhsA [Citrobacter amalonaticus]POT75990.1 thiosulfate reductase PhsA [Citrobacter amalonaticus]POU67011.1 thiosulfate reductase PhsA [Citrobacter amalonaticus]POV05225.1 thiosulfate reductase PhsA [Citrobacter amalonaticus]